MCSHAPRNVSRRAVLENQIEELLDETVVTVDKTIVTAGQDPVGAAAVVLYVRHLIDSKVG
jgi:hypothetical protein